MSRFIERLSNIKNKIAILLGVFAMLQALFAWLFAQYDNSVIGRFNRLEEDMKIFGKVVEAETDIDKWVLDNYGLELYHCNKDEEGHFKYSFIMIQSRPFHAYKSRLKRCWVYINREGKEIPIKTLKK